jgi:hypothetical protein
MRFQRLAERLPGEIEDMDVVPVIPVLAAMKGDVPALRRLPDLPASRAESLVGTIAAT